MGLLKLSLVKRSMPPWYSSLSHDDDDGDEDDDATDLEYEKLTGHEKSWSMGQQ